MRIFHIADVHINYINGQYCEEVKNKLYDARKKAFERAVMKAIKLNVDIFIIAGDLLDFPEMDYSIQKFLISQINKLTQESIISVICNGNHDPSKDIRFRNIFSSSIIFDTECVNTYSVRTKCGQKVSISGCGFRENTYYDNPLKQFPKRNIDNYHIGIIHGTLSGTTVSSHEPYMPIDKESIKKLDYNYFALGHIHKRQYFEDIGTAYSGSIQGKNRKETGIKGGYFINIDSLDELPEIKFVPLSDIVFETIEHKIDGKINNFYDLESDFSRLVNSIIANNDLSDLDYKYIIDWRLSGSSPVYNSLRYEDIVGFIENLKREFDFIELILNYDELKPVVDRKMHIYASPFLAMIDDVLNDSNKREEFVNSILDKKFLDISDNPNQRKIELEAILDDIGDEWLYRLVEK